MRVGIDVALRGVMIIAPLLGSTRRTVLLGIAAWLIAAGIVLAAVPRFIRPPPSHFAAGVRVASLSPRSLAAQCGFRAGDLILKVNGLPATEGLATLVHARHCHALAVRDDRLISFSTDLVR